MAAVTFASRVREDGSLAIPQDAMDRLGVHPGDELRVRVEAANGLVAPQFLADTLKNVLQEAERLDTGPGAESDNPDERAFGEIVRRKHRAQGLDV